MTDTQTALLHGVRVLDLSQYIPGPFATRQLADLGADVIKIEPPQGDPMRHFMYQGAGLSPIYQHLNRGKRILKLDLKQAADQACFRALLAEADVLLESFRPGVMQRLGFAYEAVQSINPRLVYCSLSGFGQTGVYRERAGHDLTYCAVAGALSATNHPTMPFPPFADHAGAMQAVNSILAALLARVLHSSVGAYLDISLCDAAFSWQYLHLLPEGLDAAWIKGGAACYQLYQTLDQRWVALAALEAKFWQAFCVAVERVDWMNRQTEPLPQQALIGELQALFASQPLSHWQQVLETVDCCFEPVPTPDTVVQHAQLQDRGVFQRQPLYPMWLNGAPVAAVSDSLTITNAVFKPLA